MKSPEALTELFRERGLKVTPQRQRIFGILHDNPQHPTAEAVYRQVRAEMPTISLRTVYQTLNDLCSMGELASVCVGAGSTRFDPNLDPHHHLVCTACGSVADFYAEFPGVEVPADEGDGFRVQRAEIVFRGLCAACARQEGRARKSQTKQKGGAQALWHS